MAEIQNKQKAPNDFIRIQDLLYLCINRWYWFVISIVVALLLGFLYVKSTPPTYNRTATILVMKDAWGNSVGDMSSIADLGLMQNNTTVSNEIAVIKSIPIMTDVVKRLHLDVNYKVEGHFYDRTLYGETCPINVFIEDEEGMKQCSFKVELLDDNRVELSQFLIPPSTDPISTSVTGMLADTLVTPAGRVVVALNPTFKGEFEEQPIWVSKSDLFSVARNYSKRLSVTIREEENSVVDLSFNDVSPQRASDVLDTLIVAYNDNWMKSQNQVAVSTSLFISDRLVSLEKDLNLVDNEISSFKSENLLPDVVAATNMQIAKANEANSKIQELSFQQSMARYFYDYLKEEDVQSQIPTNMGLGNNALENQIMEYNRILRERNNLVANSSESNPLVKDLDQNLKSLRKGIISSLDNYIVTLSRQIENMQEVERTSNSKIAANPTLATQQLSKEREQKVKESLYLFLLQKREETELSQAFTSYNAKVIQPALGPATPSAPETRNIMLAAFALGLLIPLIVIFIRENMNTKVRGRKDLEHILLPFVGEIPNWDGTKKSFIKRLFPRKKKRSDEEPIIVVKEGKRDVINEAFRVLRTNLEFIIGSDKHENVIIFTSFNPGSGKTFLSTNTAMGLALKGKRVLVIDGDLRRASTSTYVDSPKVGLSDYLAGKVDNIHELIVEYQGNENMCVLPVGTIPPNPSELLDNLRFTEMIENLKREYDYVFIDCPPIELVADTQIIARVADRTIFVIRAGLLERMMLDELDNIYQAKKYKNMALILNGTQDGNSGFNYGYSYGYHYGYTRRSQKYSHYY